MATPWKDVIQSDAYKALPPDQQEQARNQYFAQVVAPQLPDDAARSQAKMQFDKQYGPSAIRPDDVVVRPTADQLEAPSFLDNLGRSAAMTGKSLAQGAVGLGDFLATPLRAGLNAILPADQQLTTGGQAIDTLAQRALPDTNLNPQNAAERYGDAISRGIGGTLGGIGLGNVLAGSAAPVVAGIGRTLATNPGGQLAAATSGSTSSQLAKDMGAGPTGQLVAGIVGGLAPSAAGAVGNLANATLVQPFTQSGRRVLTANYLSGIAGDQPINLTPSAVPGVTPTLAEASANPGLAQLQRALANQPENAADFANLASANNAARQNYLTGALGTADDVAAATAARDASTRPLYQHAVAQTVQPTPALLDLAKRPAIAQAVEMAKDVMANRGVANADPLSSVGGLQLVKLQLDRMKNAAPGDAIGRFGKAAVSDASSDFMDEVNSLSPEFQAANTQYATASRPITAMKVGQAVQDRASGNLTDVNTGVPSLQPNAFAGALNNGDRIAQQVTGQKNATLAGTLEPDQLTALQNVRGDLERVAFANNAGRASGSNTGQNILSQNALDNFSSAVGLPGLAKTTAGKAIFTSLDKLYSVFGVPAALKADLTRVALNPTSAEAQQVWAQIPAQQRDQLYRNMQPYLTALSQAQAGQGQSQAASR